MIKALLVIYALDMGNQINGGGSLSAVTFDSMEQCKAAIVKIEKTIDKWHYGKDKNKIVPITKSLDCYELPHTKPTIPLVAEKKDTPITPITTQSQHNTWDWNSK